MKQARMRMTLNRKKTVLKDRMILTVRLKVTAFQKRKRMQMTAITKMPERMRQKMLRHMKKITQRMSMMTHRMKTVTI